MAMKRPSLAAVTMQQQHDARINPFAVQLLAESFADDDRPWGDKTLLLHGRARNGKTVYMLISTEAPSGEQFATWPE